MVIFFISKPNQHHNYHYAELYLLCYIINAVLFQNHSEPIEHATTVWETMVQKCPAKHIAIVAHSFGGVVTCDLVSYKAGWRGLRGERAAVGGKM